ncbi:MAG TPA: rhomboid family intramembrane serine protease [Chthoniobacterales bacterium]|nr:rhomboid family intramembrane serine protease [Chthoniobacterales bacterium]
MDLNHILLFLAVATPLLVLARAWRPGGIFRGWRIAAIVVLAITGLGWLFFREYAGYVGGGAWFALLFLPMIGLRRASQLAAEGRYDAALRLVRLLRILHPTSQLDEQVAVFQTLQARNLPELEAQSESLPESVFRRLRSAPGVLLLILLNVAVYFIELHREALNDPVALHRLGALDFVAVIHKGEFWRLFAALFLHYNPVHLIFNLLALYVIGPPLEKVIGFIRFTGCYIVAGIGSTTGVVLLTLAKIINPAVLVGASGCIMGIVGVWAGFLLRHRHSWQAKQRLLNIVMIIVIQMVFDFLTPQVSTSAHLCGLVTGFALGFVVRPKQRLY